MIKGYYTAAEIIDEALYAVDDVDRRHFNKAVMYFHWGYRDFNLYNNEAIAESWETVTEARTVNFPDDLMRLLSVGVSVNGELFTFTRSTKMVSPASSPLDEYLDPNRDETSDIARSPQEGYGAKAVNVESYFTVDYNKRRIVLKREAMSRYFMGDRSEVLLTYVGHGVKQLDKTYISGDAANMLIKYIVWKLIEDRPSKYPMQYIMLKKNDFEESRVMFEKLILPSIDELYDAIYETSSQNVRR